MVADNFTESKTDTCKARARRNDVLRADQLKYKLAADQSLSTVNAISLLYDFHSEALSPYPAPPTLPTGEPGAVAVNLDAAVEQRRHEDAKAKSKAMLAISTRSETFTWQVNPNPSPNLPNTHPSAGSGQETNCGGWTAFDFPG
jgi:hypothetical protein